ncbi:MAG: hemolysin family protein [Candidatus Sericytochromatia bacterium]
MEPVVPAPVQPEVIQIDLFSSGLIIAFCIMMVAILASSEAGVLSVNKIKIKNLENSGDDRAKAISDLIKNHEKLFATVLTVENAFIVFASSMSATLANKYFGDGSIGNLLTSFTMTILIVIFGEITPKTFAAQNSELVALNIAKPLRFLVNILTYPIWLLTSCTRLLIYFLNKMGIGTKGAEHTVITEGEIRMIIDEGHINQSERELIHNVFDFDEEIVSHVMTTRTMISGIQKESTVKEALLEMVSGGYSKFPVYEESLDEIIGVLYQKDLVSHILSKDSGGEDNIQDFIREVTFIPENKKIKDILTLMKDNGEHIFIVTDEYGGTEGLVTAHDILERIVGDISQDDDNDNEQEVENVDEKTFVLSGTTTIEDIKEETGIDFPEGDYQTIAGFILNKLERIPSSGERFNHENIEIIISEVVGPKILKVTVIKH